MSRVRILALALSGLLGGCAGSPSNNMPPDPAVTHPAKAAEHNQTDALSDAQRPAVVRWGNYGYGGAALLYPAYIHVLLGERDVQGNLPVTYPHAVEMQEQAAIIITRKQVLIDAIERASRLEPSGTPPQAVTQAEMQAAVETPVNPSSPDLAPIIVSAQPFQPATSERIPDMYPNTGWAVFCVLGPGVASEAEYSAMLKTGGAINPPAALTAKNCPHLTPTHEEADRLLQRYCASPASSAIRKFYAQLIERSGYPRDHDNDLESCL